MATLLEKLKARKWGARANVKSDCKPDLRSACFSQAEQPRNEQKVWQLGPSNLVHDHN